MIVLHCYRVWPLKCYHLIKLYGRQYNPLPGLTIVSANVSSKVKLSELMII